MPTTARGIWTPSDTDAVDFTTDLATMAGTIDNALDLYGNALRGTASQRAAFLSTAVDGMLWQDTDGVRMIWRKDGALWVPAVWRWRGTTAQMNSFGANAPDGFEWFSTTDNSDYVRLGGVWTSVRVPDIVSFTASVTASGFSSTAPVYYAAGSFAIPNPRATTPVASVILVPSDGGGVQWIGSPTVTATTIGIRMMRIGANPSGGTAHVILDYS